MVKPMADLRRRDLLAFAAVTPVLTAKQVWAADPVTAPGTAILEVDGRNAAQHLISARMRLPVKPGPLALVYPKWLPGEHAPVGRIEDIVALQITAGGKPLPWKRDPEDMYEIAVVVPAGTTAVDVAFEYVAGTGGRGDALPAVASQSLWILKWNHVLFYPKGSDPRSLRISASVRVPAGWSYATALIVAAKGADGVRFAPVSLETLVDSPVATGAFGRTVDVSPPQGPTHELCLFGDSAEAIEIKPPQVAGVRQLVQEAQALFGGWPYARYRYLLSLSNHVPHGGLEHHESSDNRVPERTLIDDNAWTARAGLLPHEHVHAWNGKLRRPAGLATRDYQQPMKTDLLWVYEGLTTYLGEMLTARAGLRTLQESRESLAYTAAFLDARPGRLWRPLGDTATAAPVLSGAGRAWRGLRRGLDYYPESQLIWLEADMIIRRGSNGAHTLDDFCQIFHGRHAKGAPAVVPYQLDEVLATLNEVHAHDWRGFFQQRVDAVAPHAPTGGIELGGWRLVFRDSPTAYLRKLEQAVKEVDHSFSLGLVLREDGGVIDVLPGTPAGQGGVAPAATVVAVNGRRFSRDVLAAAIAATKPPAGKTGASPATTVELLVESQDFFRSHKLAYRGGLRYPTLERAPASADLLTASWERRARS
jgi:predicted metalloprotease with PDZ domain